MTIAFRGFIRRFVVIFACGDAMSLIYADNDPLAPSGQRRGSAFSPGDALRSQLEPVAPRRGKDAPAVWEDYTGAGVLVGNLDGAAEVSNPDLIANYDTTRDYDFTTGDNDPMATAPDDQNHATSVLGIIAAARNNIGGVGVALMLLMMVMISGCGPVGMAMERPSYSGMELRIINAELALPEFAHFYPERKNTSELTVSEVNRLLGNKKCSVDPRIPEWQQNCFILSGEWKYFEKLQRTNQVSGGGLTILIDPKKVDVNQLRHIEEMLLGLCRYFPIDELVCIKGSCSREYADWFGCSPGTKRQRWYSYLLHDPDGNLLMLIDPKTQTVKHF
ncbi:MAG: hypothetical protein HQL45_05695 [Alphaproteobacteria bacterium]|nr:hypothetical protein [Alphaproteobacteria bacterium]